MFRGLKGRVYRSLSLTILQTLRCIRSVFTSPSWKFSPKTIAVIHTMALGDAMLCEPAIRTLKEIFPAAKIILITTPYTKDIFLQHPAVDEILCIPQRINSLDYLRFISQLRQKKIDAVFDFENTFFHWKRTLLSFLSGAEQRIGFTRQGYSGFLNTHEVQIPQHKHETIHYLWLLSPLKPIPAQSIVCPLLFFNAEEKKWIQKFKKELQISSHQMVIGIHPCNANALKRWKPEYFAQVIDYCTTRYNTFIVMTGALHEKPILEEIQKHTSRQVPMLTGLTIRQYILLISSLDVLISVDTSAVHIASATKTPTLALFGPTDTTCWMPSNPSQQLLIQKGLSCQPCEKTDYTSPTLNGISCPFKENICLTTLSPREIYPALNTLVKKRRKVFKT